MPYRIWTRIPDAPPPDPENPYTTAEEDPAYELVLETADEHEARVAWSDLHAPDGVFEHAPDDP